VISRLLSKHRAANGMLAYGSLAEVSDITNAFVKAGRPPEFVARRCCVGQCVVGEAPQHNTAAAAFGQGLRGNAAPTRSGIN